MMTDVLERVIIPGLGGKKSGTEEESHETQSEAWRKYLQGR